MGGGRRARAVGLINGYGVTTVRQLRSRCIVTSTDCGADPQVDMPPLKDAASLEKRRPGRPCPAPYVRYTTEWPATPSRITT